jgi:hypothetical protein
MIAVDIDNTLWHFTPALYERMKGINTDVTRPSEWNRHGGYQIFDGLTDMLHYLTA